MNDLTSWLNGMLIGLCMGVIVTALMMDWRVMRADLKASRQVL